MKLEERRGFFRSGLSLFYAPLYDQLCEILGPYWQPYYGLRTIKEQDALYAQGRTVPGAVVTEALGGESAHNYGCASDWTLWDTGGKPIWMKADDHRWVEYSEAITKVGAYWGGEFPKPDCPHNQLELKVGWKTVRPIMLDGGMGAAVDYIRKQIA